MAKNPPRKRKGTSFDAFKAEVARLRHRSRPKAQREAQESWERTLREEGPFTRTPMPDALRRNVTDRAHRYRANQLAPVAGKVCLFCASTQFLVPDHWDGHPDHTQAENLEVLCKSCNTAKGAAFKAAGRGRLTNQYNPTKGGGAANVGEWINAVGAITPHKDRGDRGLTSTMSVRDAVDMIRATSQSKRRDFAARLRRRNPGWFFSKPDARRTTPASGGIAYHTAKRRPATTKKAAGYKKAVGVSEMPSEAAIQAGFKRGLSLREILAQNPALRAFKKLKIRYYYIYDDGGSHFRGPLATLRASNEASAIRQAEKRWPKKRDFIAVDIGEPSDRSSMHRNPATASVEVFEDFHGFKPLEVVTVTKKVHHHAHLASLGVLVYLEVWGIDKQGHTLDGFQDALLACNEDRNQLFIEDGDQALDLAAFGIRQAHELETLGKVLTVGYATDKKHLGKEGGQAVYVHDFTTTNENGKHVKVPEARLPQLIYDVRNEQLLFSGGSYEIIAEGIDK